MAVKCFVFYKHTIHPNAFSSKISIWNIFKMSLFSLQVLYTCCGEFLWQIVICKYFLLLITLVSFTSLTNYSFEPRELVLSFLDSTSLLSYLLMCLTVSLFPMRALLPLMISFCSSLFSSSPLYPLAHTYIYIYLILGSIYQTVILVFLECGLFCLTSFSCK